ncbi:hypothetical protein ACA910_004166 [Epithemia clementina (nom. ined.)]
MAISTAQVKELLQSSDINAIRDTLDEIVRTESSYAESASKQEQLLKLQIMLQSRILMLQQSQNAGKAELCATYRRVASLWMRSGETERAVGQLEKALALNAEDAETLQLKARALLNLAKYNDAVDTQEKAIELLEANGGSSDEIASGFFQLASIFEAKGEFQQAIALLKKCGERDCVADKILAEIYGKIGCLYEKIGEDQFAVEALTKAHELYVKTKGENHCKTQEIAYLLEMASTSS